MKANLTQLEKYFISELLLGFWSKAYNRKDKFVRIGRIIFIAAVKMEGIMDAKRLAGEQAATYVEDGMVIGIGTGSTVYWTIQKLAELVQKGMRIRGVPTSKQTEMLALQLGIPLIPIAEVDQLDLTIDGADEVNPRLDLIKGGGGALLREKMVASISKRLIVVVDESKIVPTLGRFPLPVEVVPFGWQVSSRQISKLRGVPRLRSANDSNPFVTDNGNYLLDCDFTTIETPIDLSIAINKIPGVVENGLFTKMCDTVIIGCKDGLIKYIRN
jgi:ribose 5-phosphate isomerase A